ncbi:MAG: DUF420 domain-containing protein [Rhodospirillaceae bacterium]|nr:DUF420 domain-containing protein [Rhodospirillaceae bacterium]
MDTSTVLPHVNAVLNSVSVVLLTVGYIMIASGRRGAHRLVMVGAMVVSACFLVSYLVYHFTAPVFVFPGQGWVRPAYFTLLISHVVLASIATPLVIFTAWRAWRGYRDSPDLASTPAFARHKAIARWTLPIWLYVAVTGVMVYVILYHVYPAPGST